jgi:hypothetical protein
VSKLVLGLLCAGICYSAPVLRELQPRGAQQGKTFTLTLVGRELTEGAKIVSTLPAVFTPLTPSMKGLPFLVELKSDAAIGTYPIRLATADGISNILMFTVGAFPEIEEEPETDPQEAHDSIARARIVKSLPVTINGVLKGAGRAVYGIRGRAGEHRVFEVEARRSGSAIDPAIELLDEKGNQLARNEDAPGIGVDSRLEYTFPRDGNYFVEVHDARFSRQEQNFYRLTIGSYPYAESIFPLGGRHGATIEVEFHGQGRVARSSVKLPDQGNFLKVGLPGSPALPFSMALGDYPEVTEPVSGPLPVPVVINGRISKPSEADRYQIQVSPGDSLLCELQSRELETSRLDGLITVYDAKGKKLASAGDAPPPADVLSAQLVGRTSNDPFLNFKVPPGLTELTVAVEDIAQRGGNDFAYRLTVRKQAEEFLISASPAYLNVPRGGTALVTVTADRRGFDGPIQAAMADLPKGWTVEGGYIPAETADASNQRLQSRRGILTLTVDPDAEIPKSDLIVTGEARLSDGTVLRRRAAGMGVVIDIANGTGLPDTASTDRQKPFTAPWLEMGMPAAIAGEPPATLEITALRRTRMGEGDAYDFAWKIVTRNKDLAMPANLNVDPPGVREIHVLNMKPESKGAPTGTFTVTTTKSTAPGRYDLIATANLMVNGQKETIVSRAIPFRVGDETDAEGAKSESAGKVTTGSN